MLDHDFIAEHTHGFEEFVVWLRAAELGRIWSGIPASRRAALEADSRRSTPKSQAAIGIYGMGLTQHRAGVETVQMLVNLLLLRGNIGRDGAGICPVRGHSNVQGQRTVGITEKPELVPLDKLAEQYGFEPPRELGPQYRRGLREDPGRRGRGLRHAGRQFRARHSGSRADGAGLAAACA